MVLNVVYNSFNNVLKLGKSTLPLPVTCKKNNGSVGRQKFLFLLFIYFFCWIEKANPELKCPSINQLKREKTKDVEEQ